jgi:lipopolysaccharide/colanic/teichoic acid biosynthesis glycosyltransferase/Tfp pilus assembly PilM family ATPase
MSRAVGVEVREASVRLAWVDAGGKRPRLLAFHETPFPAEPGKPWEARASEALRAAFTASGAPRGRVVACLDSGDAILREVSLPFKTDEQIRKTVRFEMESLIHNYTIEQLVVAHYRTGETEKGATLLAAAVPKEAVAKRLKVFQDAGLDPVMLDLDVCAVFNAMNRAGAVDTDEAHLLIYGTTRFTKLVLIEGRQPRSIRTIRFSLPEDRPKAGPPLPSTGPEAIVLLDAEEAKRFGELDQGRQGSLIEILAREISRFLLANAASASPSHILLAGDFEDEDAARMLEAATEIPVRTFPLLEAVDHALPKGEAGAGAKLAAPLGLALKAAGVDALGMDFRQEEFLYRKKFEAVKTTAWVTVELVLVFLHCERVGVTARLVLDFFPHRFAKVEMDDLDGTPTMAFTTTPRDAWALTAKRALDVVASGLFLAAFSWLYLLVAAAIKLTSRGPVFYRQTRVGMNGRKFTMLKFRSMVVDAERRQAELAHLNEMDGPDFKVKNDPRITRVGRFLRKFSMDELPQMWNVFVGDMSLVGPRPPVPAEVVKYDDSQRRRLSVRPGLTCLWQISGRNTVNFEKWVELDLQYIDQWSLGLDLKILLKTVPVVLTGKGAS